MSEIDNEGVIYNVSKDTGEVSMLGQEQEQWMAEDQHE